MKCIQFNLSDWKKLPIIEKLWSKGRWNKINNAKITYIAHNIGEKNELLN